MCVKNSVFIRNLRDKITTRVKKPWLQNKCKISHTTCIGVPFQLLDFQNWSFVPGDESGFMECALLSPEICAQVTGMCTVLQHCCWMNCTLFCDYFCFSCLLFRHKSKRYKDCNSKNFLCWKWDTDVLDTSFEGWGGDVCRRLYKHMRQQYSVDGELSG